MTIPKFIVATCQVAFLVTVFYIGLVFFADHLPEMPLPDFDQCEVTYTHTSSPGNRGHDAVVIRCPFPTVLPGPCLCEGRPDCTEHIFEAGPYGQRAVTCATWGDGRSCCVVPPLIPPPTEKET